MVFSLIYVYHDVDERGLFGSVMEVYVCSSMLFNIGLQPVVCDCPEEVEDREKVTFSSPVCPEKNVDGSEGDGGIFEGFPALDL